MGGKPRRERKVVSVLFCDLVGFTQQAESLDPEDVEAILRPYHERVRGELERYGGTVEKFIGDAVMALFGAPTAHEDDPERAVRAALAIRDFALEEGLELRVGITTGEALVRLDASPEAGEGMASGDVVNTAARLQGAAPVNGILVDETTYRATRHAISYEEEEAVHAKGKAQPVLVWRALEARARFGVDVAHEARAELVGRERELALLRDAFERAVRGRTPQLVTLVGVPGIGKSRLVYELSRIADADPDIITWRQGRCLAYGDGVTLWALGEIVKAQAGVVEQDAPDAAAAKLRSSVEELLGGSGDESWVESHLRALVGLAEEAELGVDRRGEAFSAWRRYLEALAEHRPLVLVVEDLHWADDTLLDFLDELVDWVSDVPLLVVATARPELLERRPGWGGGKLNATTLALAPLSNAETAELLGRLLDQPLLAADEQQALLERAGGNPLYAEQFAELYAERGSSDDLPLPETLQGIIAARLDGLPAAEKELLQDASVVGKVFWASALGREPDEAAAALHALERKGFVRRQRRSSVEGETELAFAHALVRDVAYGQIARADRAAKHCRVAEWIESLGRFEDHAELLAHHWRSALELSRAAGADDPELARRAGLALRDAGDRAFALHAYAAAAAQYEDALALWPEDDRERPDLLFRRARALFRAYDEERRERALEEARDALLSAGEPDRAGEAEAFLSNVAWERGQGELVRTHVSRALALAGDTVSPSAARVLTVSARMALFAGENEEGLRVADAALRMSEELGLDELRAHALTTVGMAKRFLDDATGIGDIESALALALEIDSPLASPIANNLAVQALIDGDLAAAEAGYLEAARLAERFGDAASMRFLRGNLLWMDFARGRWERALERAEAFIAECEAGSPHTQEWNARVVRASIRAARGDEEGALADLSRALALTREKADPDHVRIALTLNAALLVERGELERARAYTEEAIALTREHGLHGALLHFAPSAHRLGVAEELAAAIESGPGPRAPRWRDAVLKSLAGDLAAAADVAAAMGSPTFEAQLRLHAGERLLEEGRREEGVAELRKALAFFDTVGATACAAHARELLGEQAYSESA
ncbi:MAG TPA: AAA family ATPase [Gaiellaceae bacterium]|nr:AAA family ATPase [Gaiellaceae bacterium]